MKRVEIIGVNYVGKSTLLKKLMNSRGVCPFHVVDDILRVYRRSNVIQWYTEKTLQLIQLKLFKSTSQNPYRFRKLNDLDSAILDDFTYVLELPFRPENSDFTITDKIHFYEIVKNGIEKLIFIDDNSDSLKFDILLMEEFFLHRNDLIFKSLGLLRDERFKWKNDRLLNPAAVIFLYADDEFLKQNISKRENDRRLNNQHITMHMKEIIRELNNQQALYFNLISLLEDNEVKVLRLDSSVTFSEQRDSCLNFIQNI